MNALKLKDSAATQEPTASVARTACESGGVVLVQYSISRHCMTLIHVFTCVVCRVSRVTRVSRVIFNSLEYLRCRFSSNVNI